MISLLAAAAALSLKLGFRSWLPLPPCLPSLSPFMISLLAAAAASSPKLVSLHDFAFGCRCCLVCEAWLPSGFRSWLPLPACLPSLSPFMILLLAAAAVLSPKLVSLHDFAFGCRCRPASLCRVSQACLPAWPPCLSSLSPFMISLLAAAAALSPKLVSLHDFAFGCRCRLVSQACLPS